MLTRAVDRQLWLLSRQGRASFVLTARGDLRTVSPFDREARLAAY